MTSSRRSLEKNIPVEHNKKDLAYIPESECTCVRINVLVPILGASLKIHIIIYVVLRII